MLARAALFFSILLCAQGVSATERRLTYSYESGVLASGSKELELWLTPRFGREQAYSRIDGRVELEAGVCSRLQTAGYLNLTSEAREGAGEALAAGVSNEWKLKLLDPVADLLGLSLYGEWGLSVAGLELEGKVILDKRIGPLLAALNLTLEHAWERQDGVRRRELALEQSAGLAYLVTERFGVGLEARHHLVYRSSEGFIGSALYAGPEISYGGRAFWLAISFLPQLFAMKSASHAAEAEPLELREHERFNARALVGFHL